MNPGNRFRGEVKPGPERPALYDLLRIGALSQSDFQNLLCLEVDVVEASQNVRLLAIPEPVIGGKEALVIALTLLEAADLKIPAGKSVPKGLNLGLIHIIGRIERYAQESRSGCVWM